MTYILLARKTPSLAKDNNNSPQPRAALQD